jgi:hypothetical protein
MFVSIGWQILNIKGELIRDSSSGWVAIIKQLHKLGSMASLKCPGPASCTTPPTEIASFRVRINDVITIVMHKRCPWRARKGTIFLASKMVEARVSRGLVH